MILTVGRPRPFLDATARPFTPPPLQAATVRARAAQAALAGQDAVTGFIADLLCGRG